jgi:hypothetical protein
MPEKPEVGALETKNFLEMGRAGMGGAVTDCKGLLFVSGQWEMRVSTVCDAGEREGFWW